MVEQANDTMMDTTIETTGADDFLAGLNATEPQESEPKAQDEPEQTGEESGAKPTEPEDGGKETDADKEPDKTDEPAKEDKPITIEVKYNGEIKSVTLDEAKPLIEKGMNYDKIKERYDNSPERLIVKKLADQAGKPVEEYIKLIEAKLEEANALTEAAEVLKKYPDIPQELAKEIGALRASLKAKENAEQAERQRQESEQERQKKTLEDFVRAYPDIKPEDFPKLPQTVLDAFRNGGDPVLAMKEYEMEQLKAQLKEAEEKAAKAQKVNEKNTKNKQTSVGSLGSDAAKNPSDPFLAGLIG